VATVLLLKKNFFAFASGRILARMIVWPDKGASILTKQGLNDAQITSEPPMFAQGCAGE
jgi:hypothetical protein